MAFVCTGVFDYGHGARWICSSAGLAGFYFVITVGFVLSSPSLYRDVAIAVLSLAIGSSLGDLITHSF
jgi:hypothetical protein